MDADFHEMRVSLPKGDLVMRWPRDLLARDLECLKEFVVLQLDQCIDRAARQSYAEIEYSSWNLS